MSSGAAGGVMLRPPQLAQLYPLACYLDHEGAYRDVPLPPLSAKTYPVSCKQHAECNAVTSRPNRPALILF